MLAGGRLHDDEGAASRILANQGATRLPPPSCRACPLLDDAFSNGPPNSGRPKSSGKAAMHVQGSFTVARKCQGRKITNVLEVADETPRHIKEGTEGRG